jgi:hypothetical protein
VVVGLVKEKVDLVAVKVDRFVQSMRLVEASNEYVAFEIPEPVSSMAEAVVLNDDNNDGG